MKEQFLLVKDCFTKCLIDVATRKPYGISISEDSDAKPLTIFGPTANHARREAYYHRDETA